MAISSIGIGSGLDLSNLLSQLMAAERAPMENLFNRQEAAMQAKISAYGTLRGGLSTIESPLKRMSEFEPKMTLSNSNADALDVTAADDAPAGRYSIMVNRLATSQSLATNAADAAALFADGSDTEVVAAGGTGTLSLQVGSGDATAITLDATAGALTLGDLRTAINEADAGVTASIINDGNGARLVLTASETGAANTIQMTANGMASAALDTALSLDGSNPAGNGEITQEALDAEAVINGITINSASNTLDEAVDGLGITLKATTGSAATVRVYEDRATLSALFNEFIGGYNELINQTNTLTAYDAENSTGSLLTGDSTVRGIRGMLGNAMVQGGRVIQNYGPVEVNGQTVTVNAGDSIRLANLGVMSSKTGTLSFDQSTFSEAMETYGAENVAAAVKEIASNFGAMVSSFTNSTDGRLAARTKGLQASIETINEQRENFDERMLSLEERLSAQFTAMDTLVAQMNNTSNYLATQFQNLLNTKSS